MSWDEPSPLLRTVTEFAGEQAEFLKHLFRITSDEELANLSVIKLQAEASEVAEAFLALLGMQRHDMLGRSEDELKASLSREIADVAVVVALLAASAGHSDCQESDHAGRASPGKLWHR